MNWDNYFINLCYEIAKKSKDRSTQVGCVIVGPDNEIRTTGFNGLPRRVIDKPVSEEEELFRSGKKMESSKIPEWIMDLYGDSYFDFDSIKNKINEEIECRYVERPYKYKWVSHAEFNAVCNAARTGTPLDGCTIYVPWLPCSNCAMSIIQAGIIEVVLDGNFKDDPELMKRWADEHAITNMMFDEAGILVRKSE